MNFKSFNRLTVLLGFMSFIQLNLMMYFFLMKLSFMSEFLIISNSSISFSLTLIMDPISVSFGFVVLIISFCVFLFASEYMKDDLFFNRFIFILLSFVLSMNMLIYSGSLMLLLLGWDGLGITSFALIIYYSSKSSFSAGFLTLIINRLGDVIIILCMSIFIIYGSCNINFISMQMFELVFILSLAALTKSAQYPFSAWLPAAMAAPTPVSALVHSSTLVTAGIYLLIRVSHNTPMNYNNLSLLIFCGAVTCLLGGVSAIFENDIKKIIALSTLSQLGVMLFSLGLGFSYLSLFHLYTHAMFKALLFLVAGNLLMMSFGVQDIRMLSGIMHHSPILIVYFNISSLCLIGAPFISAFYSKHAILEIMLSSNINIMSMFTMMIATMLSSIYVIRSVKVLSWVKFHPTVTYNNMSLKLMFPLTILGVLGVVCGKMFWSLNPLFIGFSFSNNNLSLTITVLAMFGVLLGLFISSPIKSFFSSSMFFLVYSSTQMNKPYSYMSKRLNNLDHGWLEPKIFMSNSSLNLLLYFNNLFMWPSKNLYSINRSLVLMLLMYFMCFNNFMW